MGMQVIRMAAARAGFKAFACVPSTTPPLPPLHKVGKGRRVNRLATVDHQHPSHGGERLMGSASLSGAGTAKTMVGRLIRRREPMAV